MKGDITDVTNDIFIYWADYINKFFYRYLAKVDPEALISTSNYTVTTSPSTQALPATFGHINTYGAGFYKLDGSTITSDMLARTGVGRTDRGFYITSTNVVFTGITSESFTLRYIPVPTKLTAVGDSLIIPDRYSFYMVQALDVIYNQWDEDAGMESLAGQRLDNELMMALQDIRKEPTVYQISDISSFY